VLLPVVRRTFSTVVRGIARFLSLSSTRALSDVAAEPAMEATTTKIPVGSGVLLLEHYADPVGPCQQCLSS